MITIGTTTFVANAKTKTQVTVSAGASVAAISSNVTGLRLSLDNQSWSAFLMLEEGTQDVWVRCGNIAGYYNQGLHWQYLDATTEEEGAWDINVTGGVPPKFENISFVLGQRAATVQYNANLINTNLSLGRTLAGSILDWNYNFDIERIQEQGAKSVINGASFAEKLVHKLIIYDVEYHYNWALLGWERPKFSDHLSAISQQLGIPIVRVGADFYPKTSMNFMLRKGLGNYRERLSGSFGSIMNDLIGWSSDVPGMAYNLFVHNGTIFIIQQGHERNTFTPTNWALNPTISKQIRHTQWADSQTQTIIPKEIASSDSANSNTPFTGTLTWGTASLRYEDGYLMEETNGNSTTTYVYTDANEGKYLASKTTETIDPDTQQVESTAVTTYTYETTGNQKYLYEENYVVTELGIVTQNKKTRHVPIGGGWYGTTVFDDDEEVSTSLSQGAPGQKVSQYMTDASNDALKDTAGSTGRQMTVALTGVAKARATYPVADYATLSNIASNLDIYEGKQEVTLQGEIVGGNHIYTFDDLIVFNGNQYHVVQNNVSQNYNKIRQNITAVRWVLS